MLVISISLKTATYPDNLLSNFKFSTALFKDIKTPYIKWLAEQWIASEFITEHQYQIVNF